MRRVLFEKQAFDDISYWSQTEPKNLRKIIDLISDIRKNPFDGIGKPEPLRHQLKGFWSRRINEEHRLVYFVNDQTVVIASCRYHYNN